MTANFQNLGFLFVKMFIFNPNHFVSRPSLCQAAKHYDQLKLLTMNFNKLYHDKGIEAAENQNYALALEYLTKSILINNGPWKIEAYKIRGFLYSNLDLQREAIEDLNIVENEVKNDVKVYLCRGSNYHILGDFDNALKDYYSALELDEYLYETNHNLYLLHKDKKQYNEALKFLIKTINVNPSEEALNEKKLIEGLIKKVEIENTRTTSVNEHLIVFIETETNGMPNSFESSYRDINNWPRLVRLNYSIYSINGKLIENNSKIIKPCDFIIPVEVSNIHTITTEIALIKGHELELVLSEFLDKIENATIIVGHNIDFYEKVLGAEFYRLFKYNPLVKFNKYCTMKNGAAICKIKNSFGYKWPKIKELYNYLFDEMNFDDLNNSNIQITAQCYFEMKKKEYTNF